MLLENIHRELKTIQQVIDRMAGNSFKFKGWAFILVSIFMTLSPYRSHLIIPMIIMCWAYDAYFLRLERLYREMYYWVYSHRVKRKKDFIFDLNPYRFKDNVGGIFKTMGSLPLVFFYMSLITVLILTFFV